jgi:hypothetical protein
METVLEEGKRKNLEDPRRPLLKRIVRERGMLWAIAAMVDGSIGYHSYTSAHNRIVQLMEDRYIYGCERTWAIFGGDSVAEIEHDFKYFMSREEDNPDRNMRVVAFVEQLSKLDDWSQTGVGLMYPTMVI